MPKPLIRVDASPRSYLAVCRDCPSWRELRGTRAAALHAAAAHADTCHGREKLAADLRRRARDLR